MCECVVSKKNNHIFKLPSILITSQEKSLKLELLQPDFFFNFKSFSQIVDIQYSLRFL